MLKISVACKVFSGFCLTLFALMAHAEETGPIESREGYVDPQSGVRVEEVKESFWTKKTRVLVTVPADKAEPEKVVEEILVTAPRPDKPEPGRPVRFELLKDYSNDRYGLYIYLGKHKDLPFRIYFKDDSSKLLENPGLQ